MIERLKRENPHRTGTTLLRELALSSGKNEPAISASTLYRFLKQRCLSDHLRATALAGNSACQSLYCSGANVEGRTRVRILFAPPDFGPPQVS
jgi:hypothetical protein